MKEDILKCLAGGHETPQKQFNEALRLYRQLPGASNTQVRFFNSLGYSENRLSSLLYELKKAGQITDIEEAEAKRKSEKKVAKPESDETGDDAVKVIGAFADFDVETAKYAKLKSVAGKLSRATKKEPADQKGETLKAFIQSFQPVIPVNDSGDGDSDTSGETVDASTLEVVDPVVETGDQGTGDQVSEEFVKKLTEFDLEEAKYNDVKSFAAEVSEVTKETPENQKAETLKAFIESAKKKHLEG